MLFSVSVTDPAGHVEQLGCPDRPWYSPTEQDVHGEPELLLYCPTLQAVQLVAPADANVSVTEPTEHRLQGLTEVLLYVPALQAVQLVAPADANVSVTDPAGHVEQLGCPGRPWYSPT